MKNNPTNAEERRKFARDLAEALARKIANDDYLAEMKAGEIKL